MPAKSNESLKRSLFQKMFTEQEWIKRHWLLFFFFSMMQKVHWRHNEKYAPNWWEKVFQRSRPIMFIWRKPLPLHSTFPYRGGRGIKDLLWREIVGVVGEWVDEKLFFTKKLFLCNDRGGKRKLLNAVWMTFSGMCWKFTMLVRKSAFAFYAREQIHK